MSSFDIRKLLDFKPARYLCLKCRALLRNSDPVRREGDKWHVVCPVCQVKYLPSGDFRWSLWRVWRDFLQSRGSAVEFQDVVAHGRQLGEIAKDFYEDAHVPPIRSLFDAMSKARHFIHFTTWNITHIMIGSLKIAAQRINVRGIVSKTEDHVRSELENYKREAPHDHFEIYCPAASLEGRPHQKLIIIDGLLAFKGSANLTHLAWRSAGNDREMVDVVTDLEEVISLNNRFFAPVWAERESEMEEIVMDDIPF